MTKHMFGISSGVALIEINHGIKGVKYFWVHFYTFLKISNKTPSLNSEDCSD